MTFTYVGPEAPVRDWVRSLSLDDVEDRAYLGVPVGATFPLVDLALIEGGIDRGDTAFASPLFQFLVRGGSPTASRPTLQTIAYSLVGAIKALGYVVSAGAALTGAEVTLGPVPGYDPDGTPFYRIEAMFGTKPTT